MEYFIKQEKGFAGALDFLTEIYSIRAAYWTASVWFLDDFRCALEAARKISIFIFIARKAWIFNMSLTKAIGRKDSIFLAVSHHFKISKKAWA